MVGWLVVALRWWACGLMTFLAIFSFPQLKSSGSGLCMEVLKKPSEKSTTTLAVAPCQEGAVEEKQQWIWKWTDNFWTYWSHLKSISTYLKPWIPGFLIELNAFLRHLVPFVIVSSWSSLYHFRSKSSLPWNKGRVYPVKPRVLWIHFSWWLCDLPVSF